MVLWFYCHLPDGFFLFVFKKHQLTSCSTSASKCSKHHVQKAVTKKEAKRDSLSGRVKNQVRKYLDRFFDAINFVLVDLMLVELELWLFLFVSLFVIDGSQNS